MTRDDPTRADSVLADIRRFAVTAARVTARGRTRFFDPDDDDQRRIARSVVIDLSTAANRLPAAFRNAHPDIDWAGIRATRNFIAHDYDGTDDELLWQATSVQVPKVADRLAAGR